MARYRGFTMLEMMAVIAVVAILATLAVPSYLGKIVVPIAGVRGYAEAPNQMTVNGENVTNIAQGLLPFECRSLGK